MFRQSNYQTMNSTSLSVPLRLDNKNRFQLVKERRQRKMEADVSQRSRIKETQTGLEEGYIIDGRERGTGLGVMSYRCE